MKLIKQKIIDNRYNVKYFCFPDIEEHELLVLIKNPSEFFNLNNSFGFIIEDVKEKTFLIVSDMFSTVKIYYTENPFKPSFEISENNLLSKKALKYYVSYRYIPAPLTFYHNVYCVPPGSVLKISIDGKKEWIKNSLNFNKQHINDEEFEQYIESVMGKFLGSEYFNNAGIFLSGGMDSSGVSYFYSKYNKTNLNAHSIIFPDKKFDENIFSSSVCSKFDINHIKHELKAQDFIDFWEKMPQIYSQPVSTHTGAGFNKILKNSKQHVFLSGYGGDEIFGGDIKYTHCLILEKFNKYIKKSGFDNENFNMEEKWQSFIRFFNTDEFIKMEKLETSLSSMINFNLCNWQPDYENFVLNNLAFYYEKIPVHPYLLPEFVKKINGLKNKFKINGAITRYIYRKWISKIFGQDFAFRQSQGFSAPLNEFFRNELKSYADEKINSFLKRNQFEQILDYNEIKAKKESVLKGENTYNYILSIIILENFLQNLERKKLHENSFHIC